MSLPLSRHRGTGLRQVTAQCVSSSYRGCFTCGRVSPGEHELSLPTCQQAATRPTAVYSARLSSRCYASHSNITQDLEEFADEDFYSILGVSPFAEPRDIKRAYYAVIREVHPDRTTDEGVTAFCALLNDIYETLSDPDRRAIYDELAGFSDDSVNPFLDTTYPRDQVFVDEFACIGCDNCVGICPKSFFKEPEHGRARAVSQTADTPEKLQEAMDSCPVSCIHWVASPQLPLLEAAMAKMERVAVWNMMAGAGANLNVFVEASLAWARRQSEIRAKRSAAASSNWIFGNTMVDFNGSYYSSAFHTGSKHKKNSNSSSSNSTHHSDSSGGSSSGSSGSWGDASHMTDRDARGIAGLAARAARVARTWKQYQEVARMVRQKPVNYLEASSSSLSVDLEGI